MRLCLPGNIFWNAEALEVFDFSFYFLFNHSGSTYWGSGRLGLTISRFIAFLRLIISRKKL